MPKQDGNHNSKGLLRSATFGFGSFNKHYHAHFYVRHKIFLVNLFCTPHLQRGGQLLPTLITSLAAVLKDDTTLVEFVTSATTSRR